MKTWSQFAGLAQARLPAGPVHLAIGMFDGVHLGHQTVIAAALQAARRAGGTAGVMTFWPHPSALFRPDQATPLIMTPPMKHAVLGRLGVDFIVEEPFTPEFARREAEGFTTWLRSCLPQLQAVYVGENWRFGHQRAGDVELLVRTAKLVGLQVHSAPRLRHEGTPISSSRIRELLKRGEIMAVNDLLGYAYFAEGIVVSGRQLGRTLGFPTLNIRWSPGLRPHFGAYAVELMEADQRIPAVANYGVRPTVGGGDEPWLEVHALGATSRGYGDTITVHWRKFLRPEMKLSGVDALREQIARDVEKAREFFGKKTSQ